MREDAFQPVVPDLAGLRAELTRLLSEGAHAPLLELVLGLLEKMAKQNTQLTIRLQAALRQMYRKKSERLSPDQLALFLSALSEEQAALAKSPDSAPPEEPPKAPPEGEAPQSPAKPSAKRPKKRPFPEALRREVKLVPVPEADRVCKGCGGGKEQMGYQSRDVWEFKPAEFFVIEERLEKCVCKKCEEGVITAIGTSKPIEGGRPGPGLLAQIVTSKVRDGCPLYRQADIYKRSGIQLSTSTLGDWFAASADMLEPLWNVAKEETLKRVVLSLDDTGMPVLDRDSPHGIKRGHIWTYVGDYDKAAFCDYTPTWAGDAPCAVLKKFKGKFVQGDGYAGINAYFQTPGAAARAGCMDHCRRKFVAALEAGHQVAAVVIALIGQVYAVESAARLASVSPEELLRRRQALSRPVMDKLYAVITNLCLTVAPKGALGKAISYAIRQWKTLCVFLDDPRVPLSNAHVERQQRRIALGRKAYLFAGSDAGAQRLAILQTFVVLCDLSDIDLFEYLRDVLGKINDWPQSRIAELLPAAWLAEKKRQQLDAQAGPLALISA